MTAFTRYAAYCTVLLLCLSTVGHCSSLSYALTVRDFLPQQCSELRSNANFNLAFTTGQSLDARCPYQTEILAGTISGHPDFDRSANALSIPGYFRAAHLISGNDGYIVGSASSGADSNHEKTVEEFMEVAPSGLPKPVYCTGNSELGFGNSIRCGLFGTGSSRKFATVGAFGVRLLVCCRTKMCVLRRPTRRSSTCGSTTTSNTTGAWVFLWT